MSKKTSLYLTYTALLFYLQEMGKSPKYTYGVVKSSYVDSFFEYNEDPAMKEMFRVMQAQGFLVRNFTVGVDRVQEGYVCVN